MMLNDFDQLWKKQLQRVAIARRRQISVDRVKIPERRICGMVQTLLFAFRKQIGNQSVTYVMSESAQNVAGFDMPPGGKSEPFEAHHRVAAPIGEPVISGNYRT